MIFCGFVEGCSNRCGFAMGCGYCGLWLVCFWVVGCHGLWLFLKGGWFSGLWVDLFLRVNFVGWVKDVEVCGGQGWKVDR